MKLAVSALLLTFVTAITAGFFVYQFSSSLTEKMKTAFPSQPLQLETVTINNTCLTFWVRSYASVGVQVSEVYINDSKYDLKENIVVYSGTVGTVQLRGSYVRGETYKVKVVPSFGSPLVFTKKYF